jgi:hypothetical protein
MEQSKRRGRPLKAEKKLRDPLVSVRLPPPLLQSLEDWAKQHGATRSEAARSLIEAGLNATPKPPHQ